MLFDKKCQKNQLAQNLRRLNSRKDNKRDTFMQQQQLTFLNINILHKRNAGQNFTFAAKNGIFFAMVKWKIYDGAQNFVYLFNKLYLLRKNDRQFDQWWFGFPGAQNLQSKYRRKKEFYFKKRPPLCFTFTSFNVKIYNKRERQLKRVINVKKRSKNRVLVYVASTTLLFPRARRNQEKQFEA